MPTYGDSKRRDMVRSVLPSTRRKGARDDKRAVHQRTRARVRSALDPLGAWDEWGSADAADGLLADAQHDGSWSDIRSVVTERRYGDKTASLVRWAERKAPEFGKTPEERGAAVRAILPDGLTGWHAWTHVESLEAYETNPHYRWWRYPTRRRSWQSRYDCLVHALDDRLDRIGELNAQLKRAFPAFQDEFGAWTCNRRLWAGRHDTPDFAAWALRTSCSIVEEFADLGDGRLS